MKRFLSLLLSVLVAFSAFPMTAAASGAETQQPEMTAEAFSKAAGNDMALSALFQFDRDLPRYNWGAGAPTPAKLTGVTYTLADNVVEVNSDVTGSIRSIRQIENPGSAAGGSINRILDQGGMIRADQLKAAADLPFIKPGSVFVDLDNDLAFKVPTLPSEAGDKFDGYVPAIKPSMQEVIKDFNIPAQNVQLNQANVSHFVKDADGNSLAKYLKKPGQTYIMSQNTAMEPIKPTHLKNIIAEFQFPENGITLNGVTPSGGTVAVNVKGYLGIGDMGLDGYYQKWKYAFWFSVAEEMQLQATVAMDMKEEVRIPILGVDVGFDSKIGSIAGGLFLVVGVDGQFRLEMEARQWVKLDKVGLQGKNAFYVPCTIGPLYKVGDNGFDLDAHFNGRVDGYVKAGALLELSLLGLDIVGAGAFAGMGARSTVAGDYIETDLYGIVQAYVKFLGKHKNVINWQPNIFHKRQVNTAGYIVTFKEVCAYRDEVWGDLQYDAGVKGFLTEPGKDITLLVRRPPVESGINVSVSEKSYPAKTDENGNFHLSGVDLQKGDQVYIRLKERGAANADGTNEDGTKDVNSAPTNPTFPFDKVGILEADFFNDYIKGYVPPVIVKDWDTGGQKELVFELGKSKNSSLKVNAAGIDTDVDSHGLFNLTGINVLPTDAVFCQLKFDGWVVTSKVVKPTVDFSGQSIRFPVSYERTAENGKPTDMTKTEETIVITNNRGTKVYTGDATFTVSGYTQAAALCYIPNPETGLPVLQAFGLEDQTKPLKLYAIAGAGPDDLGASYFVNSITRKWVWEPNPDTKTRPDGEQGPSLPTRPDIPDIEPPVILPPTRNILPPADADTSLTRDVTQQTRVTSPAINAPVLPPPTIAPTPETPSPTTPDLTAPGILPVRPILPDLSLIFPRFPQNSFLLRFDDLFDKYSDYDYYNTATGRMENYSEQADGSQAIKWDGRIVIPYEGAQIVVEVKDDRRTGGDSKFETLSTEWLNRDVEGLLNRYMEKMGGSLVFPMPDEINKGSGISNMTALPAWSKQATQRMVDAGIMDLGAGETFKSGSVSRSECAAYLVHAFGIAPEAKKTTFSDIVPANPYIPEINAAVSHGIISGYSTASFGPGDPVTREQMAVMVMRGLKAKLGSRLSIPGAAKTFSDRGKFSSWSASAISEISSLGIMNGYADGRFGAGDNITFNEMAVMLNNLNNLLLKY